MKLFKYLLPVMIIVLTAAGISLYSQDTDSYASAAILRENTGSVNELINKLTTSGFIVQNGKFQFFDTGTCCDPDNSCFYNNPTSPYAEYFLPRAPGQTFQNPKENSEGLSSVFYLRPDEALIFIGKTPPQAKYMGFRSYVFDRMETDDERLVVFASLGDTLNNQVIKTSGPVNNPFDQHTIVITAADRGIVKKVINDLLAAGYDESIINFDIIPPEKVKLGLEETDDTFRSLFRVAMFEDEIAGQAYINNPPAAILRITPGFSHVSDPYPAPELRERGTGTNELSLLLALKALGSAIRRANSEDLAERELFVQKIELDGYECIEDGNNCNGDNRDAIYMRSAMFYLDQPVEYVIVYGINHTKAGKATYSNFTLNTPENKLGIDSIDDQRYEGSAADYLPNHPLARYLYAWKISRNCNGEPHCMEVPEECPGVPVGGLAFILYRAYLENETDTGPAKQELLADRAILFRNKK